jgi:hypothetical protein
MLDEEANFCAGATQIHTHSPTCVKYSISKPSRNRDLCPMAVGLRHNHDISFIASQCKTMAVVYYVTNYATKLDDPIWKRVAAAAEVFSAVEGSAIGCTVDIRESANGVENRMRQFLMRVANRIFRATVVTGRGYCTSDGVQNGIYK